MEKLETLNEVNNELTARELEIYNLDQIAISEGYNCWADLMEALQEFSVWS